MKIDQQISRKRARIEKLDSKIAQLMAARADEEEALADLYKRRAPSPQSSDEQREGNG